MLKYIKQQKAVCFGLVGLFALFVLLWFGFVFGSVLNTARVSGDRLKT